MTFSPKEISISIFFVWGKHIRKQTSNSKLIFKERVSWSPGWVGTIYGSRVALNSWPSSLHILHQVLGTEPGLSALYWLSYIPCPKFYNVSSSVLSNTFKWAPKCTHLPLINKSKLSQVYKRSIQPGGLACLRSERSSISSVPQFHFAPTLNPGGVIVL